MRLSAAKGRLDRSLNTAEQELQEAQQQILMLQVRTGHKSKLDHLPPTHRLTREAAAARAWRPPPPSPRWVL